MSRRTRDVRQGDLFGASAEAAAAPRGCPEMPREALLERLANPGAARLTVLTPNLRLAQALTAEVDAIHIAARRSHWEAPDVLS